MKHPKRLSAILFFISISVFIWASCNTKAPISTQAETENTVKHDQDVTTDETWNSDKTHIVASEITINSGIVRIKPGTTVQFEKDAAISVTNGAGLIADGSEQSIIFTASNTQKGAWKCIHFSDGARDDSCKLINCSFDYGGGDSTCGTIICCENSSPTITGCTISNSPNNGVELIGDCRGIKFHDNTISNCDFMPVQTDAINVSSIGINSYQDNGLNQIRVVEGNVISNDTWQNLSVPYRLADGLKIKNATLKIDPAVELIFEEDEPAIISDGGSIQAIGTPSERIIFTGSFTGSWNGVYFNNTANDINSKLIYCIIENGGNDNNLPANIILEDASPEIFNCLIRQSISYGIYVLGKVKPGNFINNTITNNAFAPISVSAKGVNGISAGYYLGNGMNFIEVRGGPLEEPIIEDGYWDNIGMPYQVKGAVQIQSSTLILAPGLDIQMTEGSGFEVLIQGGLIADGTSEMITIEGSQQSSGSWNNIYYSSTANANNCQLIHCRIGYGGGDIYRPGMIYCDNLSPTIRNCIIESSLTYGIYLNGIANIIDLQSNLFNGNGYGNYYHNP
jgi:hypothetical protein